MAYIQLKFKLLVMPDGRNISMESLSDNEIKIITFLAKNYPLASNRDEILKNCWEGKVVTENSVNVAISNIRSFFQKENIQDFIVTLRGEGYQLSEKIIIKESNDPAVLNSLSMGINLFLTSIKNHPAIFLLNIITFLIVIAIIKLYTWIILL